MLHVLIPAKLHSARVPNKNTTIIGGKPLIIWTLETLHLWPDTTHLIVATDSQEIANLAQPYNPEIFWINSDNYRNNGQLWSEVASKYNGTHALMQATSPFRLKCDINKAWELYQSGYYDCVISCTKIKFFIIDKNGILKCSIEDTKKLSQEREEQFTPNGALYISNSQYLTTCKSLYTGKIGVVATSPFSGLDIDTPEDLEIAKETIEWYETHSTVNIS